MRFPLFLLAALASVASVRADILAFERGGSVNVSNEKGGDLRKLAKGVYPAISPDGSQVAFNTEAEKSTDRLITIVDVATKKITKLPAISSNNCYGPVWSRDGQKLAFQMYDQDKWGLGIIDRDGTGFQAIKFPAGVTDLWQPNWSVDGKSLFCHDLEKIYQVDLDGRILRKWQIDSLAPHAGMSSGSRLSISGDGRWLLMDLDMDEDTTFPDWDGPPPAIWKMDIATGKAQRLTPKGVLAWSPQWASANEIFCLGMAKASGPTSIYTISMEGSPRVFLLKDASSPSLATGVSLNAKK